MTKHEHYHFIEIAGNAMSGVALAVRQLGFKVTGSDVNAYPSATTQLLEDQGVEWWREPSPERLEGVSRIIVSGVTMPDFPELVWAKEHNVPVISFAELVGELTHGEENIVVSGTHGKTTTSSMIAWVLESAGLQPDYMIGIKPKNFSSSVSLRHKKVAVIEGDEYTASQLVRRPKFDFYHPDRLILTSLEMDHPDVFKDLADISGHFQSLIGGLKDGSHLYKWVGSEALAALETPTGVMVSTYGVEAGEWQAVNVGYGRDGMSYDLTHKGEPRGHLRVPLYGVHNVANSVAAVALLLDYGLSHDEIQKGLNGFRGASRRFELTSAPNAAVRVIDDYAHHPTEVKATIAAAKRHFGGRLIVAFRPHTYSRTQTLLADYYEAFAEADIAFITDIESAREVGHAHTVTAEDVVRGASGNVYYEPDRDKLVDRIAAEARPDDTILCMSVSGYNRLAKSVATRLEQTT